jgi:hypothetical protein
MCSDDLGDVRAIEKKTDFQDFHGHSAKEKEDSQIVGHESWWESVLEFELEYEMELVRIFVMMIVVVAFAVVYEFVFVFVLQYFRSMEWPNTQNQNFVVIDLHEEVEVVQNYEMVDVSVIRIVESKWTSSGSCNWYWSGGRPEKLEDAVMAISVH